MITTVLEFIHARKWIVELIILLTVVGGVWWFCHHLIEVGVQQQKEADAVEYAKLKEAADKETGRLQGIADAAEHSHDKELTDLRNYRNDNPLHGGLCNDAKQSGRVREAAATHTSDESAGTSSTTLQPLSSGDSGAVRPAEPDIRHLLDLLTGRGDQVSAELRECQSRLAN